MSETVPRACVMGYPVAHSRSPLLHRYWLKANGLAGTYEKAEVTAEDFPAFLQTLGARGYRGGNVTVPHKEAAFRIVGRHDAAAAAIGAVNTVWHEGDRLVGGNTDAYGFAAHLDASAPGWVERVRRAVVLGAGGAARAVVHALLERGVDVALVNRSPARAHEVAAHFSDRPRAHARGELAPLMAGADLLVNATSLGMAGRPALDLDLERLKAGAVVYDLVYVPLETALLRSARQRGHQAIDGLGMLLHQAVPGFARWFGVTPSVTSELRAIVESDIRTTAGAA